MARGIIFSISIEIIGFRVLLIVIIISIRRIIRIRVIRVTYISIFSIPRVDISRADFSIGILFYNNYISAYYIHFFAYII